jgi:hypothetical protein
VFEILRRQTAQKVLPPLAFLVPQLIVNTPNFVNGTGQAGNAPSSEWGSWDAFLVDSITFRAYGANAIG